LRVDCISKLGGRRARGSERLVTARAERRIPVRVATPWAILLAGCAAVLTLADTLPIARTTGLFTGGG
jgi:hypothetical protein